MSYVIDVTPAIVNKTAIFRLIEDTIKELGACFAKKLVCGRVFSSAESFYQQPPLIMKLALKYPRAYIFFRPLFKYFLPNPNEKVLFFDPLYTLFYSYKVKGSCFILDLTPVTHPSWHGRAVAMLYQRAFKELSYSNLEILAISESTKLEYLNIYNKNKNVKVIYLYSDPMFEKRVNLDHKKEVLFVGSFEQRKNVMGLIRAFVSSSLPSMGYVLNIVGSKTDWFRKNEVEINGCSHVNILDYLSNEELKLKYNSATMFAYPSFWEGFGVPLLEAMQIGVPALASKVSAIPEVGGRGLIYVDPYDIESIKNGLESLALMDQENRIKYIQMQFKQAENFSKNRFIKELKSILQC